MHAFYFAQPSGGLTATVSTRGPWSPDAQHAGPPTALIVRAAEQAFPDQQVARLTVELVRPVMIGPVEVALSTERAGRRTTQVSATLSTGGVVCMTARLLLVRPADVVLPPTLTTPTVPPTLASCAPFAFPFFQTDEGYHRAVEIRVGAGTFGQGDLSAWMRPRVPLVEGEATSPTQAAAIVLDAGSGLGLLLDTSRYTFLNADLTLHFLRPPRGNAVYMHAVTTVAPGGRGLCTTAFSDEDGPVGHALQTLILAAR